MRDDDMAGLGEATIETLIGRVSAGDATARSELLTRYRERLSRTVNLRMDRRVVARLDASDVVQETLLDADRRLADYIERQPLPFFLWLRQMALERLEKNHRFHVAAQKRSVTREALGPMMYSDESVSILAAQLASDDTSPSQSLVRRETCQEIRDALDSIDTSGREILVMKYAEQLSNAEIAAATGTTVAAIKMKHLRALRRLREKVGSPK